MNGVTVKGKDIKRIVSAMYVLYKAGYSDQQMTGWLEKVFEQVGHPRLLLKLCYGCVRACFEIPTVDWGEDVNWKISIDVATLNEICKSILATSKIDLWLDGETVKLKDDKTGVERTLRQKPVSPSTYDFYEGEDLNMMARIDRRAFGTCLGNALKFVMPYGPNKYRQIFTSVALIVHSEKMLIETSDSYRLYQAEMTNCVGGDVKERFEIIGKELPYEVFMPCSVATAVQALKLDKSVLDGNCTLSLTGWHTCHAWIRLQVGGCSYVDFQNTNERWPAFYKVIDDGKLHGKDAMVDTKELYNIISKLKPIKSKKHADPIKLICNNGFLSIESSSGNCTIRSEIDEEYIVGYNWWFLCDSLSIPKTDKARVWLPVRESSGWPLVIQSCEPKYTERTALMPEQL